MLAAEQGSVEAVDEPQQRPSKRREVSTNEHQHEDPDADRRRAEGGGLLMNEESLLPPSQTAGMTEMPDGLAYVTANATLCPDHGGEVTHITVGARAYDADDALGEMQELLHLTPVNAVRLARSLLAVAVEMIDEDEFGPDEEDRPPDLRSV